MAIPSDRLVKKFFIAGHRDTMPLWNEGYSTFQEAADQVSYLQEPGHMPTPSDLYIFEAFVAELLSS